VSERHQDHGTVTMYLRADPAAFVKGGNDQKRSHAAAKAAEAAAPEATEAAPAA
jgi:hypothetical protein